MFEPGANGRVPQGGGERFQIAVIEVFPPISAEFGVVVAAKPEHLHWVKGTCASVRYFMGDTPICLVLDGDRPPPDLQATYDVRVIRRADVEHRELRELSFGSLRTKSAALWVAPFETYLLLDADAIVWGDMRQLADFERFDFIVNTPIGRPAAVRKWVMDADAVSRHFPHFDARRHVADFVNTGAYFARRGKLELEHYLELVRFCRSHPGMFYGDQGVFNLMLFSGADEGTLRLQQRELQITTGDTTREEVARRFSFVHGQPSVVGAPVVLHWAGSPKPRIRARGRDYFEPMTFFRRQFRVALRGDRGSRATDELWLRFEDALCADWRGSNLRARLRRKRRRALSVYAQTRGALRRRTPDWLVSRIRRSRHRPTPPARRP
jgi:hypothetical protein